MGMVTARTRTHLELWAITGMVVWMTVACRTSTPIERPAPPAVVEPPAAPPATMSDFYAADEALRDALSGEWEHLGTGRWPGIERSHACAYRNGRVVIVNAYCTVTERQAFRVDVYSPERGRVRIYAEADGPLSERGRDNYFIFTAETEPLGAAPGPVALTMSFAELQRYEQERYDAYLPACYGGQRHGEQVGGCLGALEPEADQWAARHRAFLASANDDWHRVVREMRALAAEHGTDPE